MAKSNNKPAAKEKETPSKTQAKQVCNWLNRSKQVVTRAAFSVTYLSLFILISNSKSRRIVVVKSTSYSVGKVLCYILLFQQQNTPKAGGKKDDGKKASAKTPEPVRYL